ncbi:MAG: hypothetical protein KatS3mg014_1074 [Actinomycetota bacterium]|nr:MAG: hypothetical protein KatS3mg014_1074 [Actinomycetota bacterium]
MARIVLRMSAGAPSRARTTASSVSVMFVPVSASGTG